MKIPYHAKSVLKTLKIKYNNCICGYFAGCQRALGMQSGAIANRQIRASSEWDANHAAIQGRLGFRAAPGKAGSWSARVNDGNQWLQIDLGNRYTRVAGVTTQGRNGYSQWVTKYRLQYSDNGVNFKYYRDPRQVAAKVK